MRLLGARRARGTGERPLDGYSNYYLGKRENSNRSEGESARTEYSRIYLPTAILRVLSASMRDEVRVS